MPLEEIVKGSVMGAREYGVEIALVGLVESIEKELARHETPDVNTATVKAKEFLVESAHPAYALRQKRNASILVATKLVRSKTCFWLFSLKLPQVVLFPF